VARAERFPQAGRAFHRSASQVTRHHPVSRRLSLPTCPSYGPTRFELMINLQTASRLA